MSIFGWSYPPGCNGTPFYEDHPCELCGLFEDKCICPACPVCGEAANPRCYKPEGCGQSRTPEQVASLAEQERKWAEQNAIEENRAPEEW